MIAPGFLVAVALVAALPRAVPAQCTASPRVIVADTDCSVGEACNVTASLEAGSEAIAAIAATLSTSADLACTGTCNAGAAASNATCVANPDTCRFNLLDLAPPVDAFADGVVVDVEVVCNQAATASLTFETLSLGDTQGSPVAGCATEAVLTCIDRCDGVDCDDGEPCTIDVCNGATGQCEHTAELDGTACDDASDCTVDDACASATCVGETRCGAPISLGVPPVASDALFALRVAVGADVCLACFCDVNGDGSITVSDVLAILLSAIGFEVAFDCG